MVRVYKRRLRSPFYKKKRGKVVTVVRRKTVKVGLDPYHFMDEIGRYPTPEEQEYLEKHSPYMEELE